MDKFQIIVADDHEIFLEGLKSLIEQASIIEIVGLAKNGQEMMSLLKKTKPDIIVTDLSMPEMDGITAIKNIRKQYADVKILVLTMQKDHEHFKHAMSLGASGYLLKDDAFDHFVHAIKSIMEDKPYVSPSLAQIETDRFIRSLDETEAPALDILTKREQQILKHIANGKANKNIAVELDISIRTVETHRINLSNKLGIKNTAGLVKYAISKGLA